MRVPNLMLSSILNRLMPSLSACGPQVGRWICIMPIASLAEMAKGLARLSTIIMLATSRGSTLYLRPLATMAPAIRGRWPSSTLCFSRKAFIFATAGSSRTTDGVCGGACRRGRSVSLSEKTSVVGVEKSKTRTEANTVKISNLYDFESEILQANQWTIYRRFHPTFIPRHRLQNAIGCISPPFGGWRNPRVVRETNWYEIPDPRLGVVPSLLKS